LLLAGGVAAAALLLAVWGRPDFGATSGEGAADARYATQRAAPAAVRMAQVAQVNAEAEDLGLETCSAVGLEPLATRFSVPARPEAVARAFASQWDPAYRPGAYEGCLEGLVAGA
jgi:hypothetical protein